MNRKFFSASLLGLGLGLSVAAFADLESMKARVPEIVKLKEQGIIGENPMGLLGTVKDDPAAKKVVDAENADRRKIYEQRAKQQGVSVETLQKVLGAKRLETEPAKRFIQDDTGKWIQKK